MYSHHARSVPEVLAPAGNLQSLKTAVDFGADAVYCGGKSFGMRTASKNLTLEEFEEGVAYAHQRDARVYVTANILPDSHEVEAMNDYLGQLADIGLDAFIVADIGVLMNARQNFPHMALHVSTQAGVTNYQAANALYQLGAQRVVLARELSLEDIRAVRAQIAPELEIEAFVHGSMCMAFSGRCLISKHTTGRDANHGDCAQSCRWKYHVMEEKRPGELIPVELNDQGTFIFNSHDMNMISHIDDVLDAGVSSLKIEGRAKSILYTAAMSNAYSCAVDEYLFQRGFIDEDGAQLKPFHDQVNPPADATEAKKVQFSDWILEEPFKVTHREYSTGFYYPEEPAGENIITGVNINDWLLVGTVTGYDEGAQRVLIHSKNKIEHGQTVEFVVPNGRPIRFVVPHEGLQDAGGKPVDSINNPAHDFSIPCPIRIPQGAFMRSPNPRANRVVSIPVQAKARKRASAAK